MKIVHICLASFFPDGYSYQENMLPKFHKELGYEVEVITSLFTFNKDGKGVYYPKPCEYKNEYDIPVIRLAYKSPQKMYRKLRRYDGLKAALEKTKPDILFVHGCQFLDIDIIKDYVKENSKTKMFIDNHADFSNSAKNFLSKNVLHKIIWKRCARLIEPYTCKFYGVLPARVSFLKNVYKLPSEKCELLVMGADDDAVQAANSPAVVSEIREKYNIQNTDILIMSGGKIDLFKKQTLLLMEAVSKIENPRVKLIVFGSVVPELKEQVESLSDGIKVQYIGWVDSQDSYNYFAAADLVVFPGRHSVFWEQVTGQGKPMIVKDWAGTHHIDLGGNVSFLTEDSAEEIQNKIEEMVENPEILNRMKDVAMKEGMKKFSYKTIAERSVQK